MRNQDASSSGQSSTWALALRGAAPVLLSATFFFGAIGELTHQDAASILTGGLSEKDRWRMHIVAAPKGSLHAGTVGFGQNALSGKSDPNPDAIAALETQMPAHRIIGGDLGVRVPNFGTGGEAGVVLPEGGDEIITASLGPTMSARFSPEDGIAQAMPARLSDGTTVNRSAKGTFLISRVEARLIDEVDHDMPSAEEIVEAMVFGEPFTVATGRFESD
ncbi:MAG: hypothetical protein AAF638_13415, partial [Pseudomonadota bacterium]